MSLPSLYALSTALHFYLGVRLVPSLGEPAAPLLALVLALSAMALPAGLVARRLARPPASDALAWIGMVFLGFFSSLLVLAIGRDVVLLGMALASLGGTDLPRDAVRTVTAQFVAGAALVLTGYGLWNARRPPRVVTVDVPIAGLPRGLDGFRIVQITDIHVGPTIKKPYLDAIVDQVNALHPDVVAITGDLVDGSVAELGEHVAPLARLRAAHGSYFVTGNHEYYSGADAWLREVARLGVRVLMNEHVVLSHGGAKLVLAGVADYSAGHFIPAHASDAEAALRGAPDGAAKVLLAHQPRSAPAAARAGFDLPVSGHTHGGQFLPWNLFVPLQQPYTAGLHRLSSMWIYVSRGTGYWGPPKRVGAPSEITQLHLRAV
jgi:predicted MPP superfamily phosphohydrolase